MTTVITITSTPRRSGTTKVETYGTLIAARAAIMRISDRHLTNAESAEWRRSAGK